MGLILNQIFGLIKILNSETGTHQIATGVAAGFVLGMTPAFSLQSVVIFLCLFFFRIQAGAALITAFFFAFIAYLLDPVFDVVGSWVLTRPELGELFTTLYNLPIVPLTRFNNSIVMGSGIVAFMLSPFIYWAALVLVSRYRVHIVARFRSTRFWKGLQATSLYKWYHKYEMLKSET